MKSCIALCLFAVVAVALGRPEEKYTDKYDSLNVEEVIHNDKLFETHMKCLLDTGKCPPDGTELKSHVKEAMENYCAKCTEAQKKAVRIVIKFLINDKPESWAQLTKKYDPTNKYSKKYEEELKKIKA